VPLMPGSRRHSSPLPKTPPLGLLHPPQLGMRRWAVQTRKNNMTLDNPHRQDPYDAAAETARDMVFSVPGSPFQGLRSVLGCAVRLNGVQRKAAIRARLNELFATTYYSNSSLWESSTAYRNALVQVLDSLAQEDQSYHQAMQEMRSSARAKIKGSANARIRI